VASVPVHRGDLVMPGQRLLVLEGDDGYEAQLTVESAAALRLTRGEAVAVRVDGFASPMPGRVRSVAPAGDPQTHRFLARVDLPRDPRLRSGVFASAEVPGLSGGVSRLFIPAQAVFARGGLTGVYVVEGGHAELRWIAVGERQGEVLEVRAGLSAGEKVALSPEGLSDGAPVTAAP
jgi:membrane fusion protein, multidrug efflux system